MFFIWIILGTRPEIIKMAPIMDELDRRGRPYKLIHTGQHYSYNMSRVFLDELGLSKKKMVFLDIGSGGHSDQTARAMLGLEKAILKAPAREKPSMLLVEGDTNTVLAGGLVGAKLGVPVGHVEAGLRSYDYRMPEEHNRRVVDHISTLLFAPTRLNAKTLRDEKVPGKVFVTGNTVIDACQKNIKIAQKKVKLDTLLDNIDASGRVVMRKTGPVWGCSALTHRFPKAIEKDNFVLVTIHRAENVDDANVLKGLLEAFKSISSKYELPLILPLHPRTVKNIKRFGLENKLSSIGNLRLIEPVGYFEFLLLMKHCAFVMSDSGGIQEEVTAPSIRKKCFVLRTSTERPEAVTAGYCKMVGVRPKDIVAGVNGWMDHGCRRPRGKSPYGDGKAGWVIIGKMK